MYFAALLDSIQSSIRTISQQAIFLKTNSCEYHPSPSTAGTVRCSIARGKGAVGQLSFHSVLVKWQLVQFSIQIVLILSYTELSLLLHSGEYCGFCRDQLDLQEVLQTHKVQVPTW